MKSNAVRFTKKFLKKDFYSYALLLICISSLGFTGCSGLVSGNSVTQAPPALAITGVQAATPTTTGFQVNWSTSLAASSAVDYGTTATYGSSTTTNTSMVTSHQVAVTGLSAGTLYHFRVRSTDAANTSASSPDMTFATAGDTTPPTVSITAPAANATISGVTIVSASATDNVGVTSVQFKVDNANTGAAITAAPYNYSLNTSTLSNGNHILTAVASDAAGNTTTSAGVAVKVSNITDTTPPTVSITAPANGATVSGTVSVTANASDNVGVASVQFLLDGANLGALDTASPYSASWSTTTASNASHILTAIAKDAAGNSTTSTAVTVTVNNVADTTPPSVPAGLSATAISSSQINLSWTASTDNVGVTGYNIFRNGTKVGTSPNTAYQDVSLIASTSYNYNVSAFDAAGNTSAQSSGASATTLAGSSGGGIPSALGWYQIPNTTLAAVCPPANSPNCQNVIGAWSGGLADTSRNRLVVWGGGHTDYDGNEVYALDLNALTFVRLNNPSAATDTCVAANPDGTANARHSYGGLAYIPSVDRMFVRDGSLACSAGSSAHDTWTFAFSNLSWQRMDPTTNIGATSGQTGFGDSADYNSSTGLVYLHDTYSVFSYNYSTNTYNRLGTLNPNDYHQSGVVDPGRQFYFIVGDGIGMKMDINPSHSFATSNLSMSGCGAMLSTNYPGLAYDTVQKLIVGWAGGDTVYLYNPDTDSCTSQTYSGGPGAAQNNGTFGRFRYFPSLGVFAVVNGWQENGYSLRLTPASGGSGSGPNISAITVSTITATTATVAWTTDVPATTQLEYGTTTSYGTLTTLNSSLVTAHTVALTGLPASTLFHYRVHSKNSAGVESISSDAAFSTNGTGDTTPPTVTMTAPASGATVTGPITVSATASDNVGVTSLQFILDGANVGSAFAAGPYQMTWDTTTVANGSHSLTAVASDAAGNTRTAAAVTVTVSNSGSSAAAAALQDYNARCGAAGVVYCQGFDDSTGFQQNVNIFPNSTYPTVFPAQDATTARSGNSSLRIDVPAFQGPNMGRFADTFNGPFADNSDLYFQLATRISPEMLSNPQNGTYQWPQWKNHSFFNGNSSCTQLDVTNGLNYDDEIPLLYTQCGGAAYVSNGGVPPYLMEQGDYNCPYRGETPSLCWFWQTNTWITFYYHVHLTSADSSGNFPNSTIEAWVATNGQPYKKWISFIGNYNQPGNGAGQGFNSFELYPYMTGKDASIGGYPTAHVWYDEVIISKQPIAAPAVPPALP
jgi:chitodextrinase